MRAVTYSRVSTSHHDQNPEVQKLALQDFCAARGWDIFEEITDHGYSGGTDKRPGLIKLMTLVRSRKVDVVVVTKMDRIFRSLKHLVGLLDEFETLGVKFVSVTDMVDMTTSTGKLLTHILASFAEFEKNLIRERTLAGLAHARRQGKRLGRPKTRNDTAILALRARGLSYSQIQRKLGTSRPSIRRALLAAGTKSPR